MAANNLFSPGDVYISLEDGRYYLVILVVRDAATFRVKICYSDYETGEGWICGPDEFRQKFEMVIDKH